MKSFKKFQVGDKVKCINTLGIGLRENYIYTVSFVGSSIKNNTDYAVYLAEYGKDAWFSSYRFDIAKREELLEE